MKKQKKQRALQIVREYFPGVVQLNDATKPVVIEVTPKDSEESVVQDHTACAYAVACKRQMKADGVIIGTKTAYIIYGKKAVRYRMNESVSREIVSFDRKAGFAVGTYQLRAPSECEQLGAGHTGKTHNPSDRKPKRFQHITSNIRTTLGRHAALIVAALCFLGSAQAGTVDFSGVITAVNVHPGDANIIPPSAVHTVPGDAFSGHVDFTNDGLLLFTIVMSIDPDVFFEVDNGTNGYDGNLHEGGLGPSGRSGYFYTHLGPFGGTDFAFGYDLSDNSFIFGDNVNSALPDEDKARVTMTGTITQHTVSTPENGSTALLLMLGVVALVSYWRPHQ